MEINKDNENELYYGLIDFYENKIRDYLFMKGTIEKASKDSGLSKYQFEMLKEKSIMVLKSNYDVIKDTEIKIPEYIEIAEIMERTGFSKSKVRYLEENGKLNKIVPGKLIYDRKSAEEYIADVLERRAMMEGER